MSPRKPLINSWILCSQKNTGRYIEFPIFVFSNFGPRFTRRFVVVFFCVSPKNYSQGFLELRRGGQKERKNKVFGGLSRVWFYHFVSSWSPFVFIYFVVCKCVIHPCFLSLLLCFSSLLWLCFIASIHLYLYRVFYFSVVFCCILPWCNKTQITS